MKTITPGITALLGFSLKGPIIWEPRRDGHLAILGGPGTGKSTLAGAIAAGLSDDADVIALTSPIGMPNEFRRLRTVQLVTTPQTHLKALEKIYNELRRRFLTTLGNPAATHKPTLVVLDDILRPEAPLQQTKTNLVNQLLETGRSLGVHLVITGSRATPVHGLTRQSPVFLQDQNPAADYGHMTSSLKCPRRQHLDHGQGIFVPAAHGKDPVGFTFARSIPIDAPTRT
jgi:hypothetical protein